MLRNSPLPSRLEALPLFELGDRVLVQPSKEGTIIGVRYGEVAYDVLCGGEYLRDLSPELIRLASPRLSEVA
jgi:hypothetical protein